MIFFICLKTSFKRLDAPNLKYLGSNQSSPISSFIKTRYRIASFASFIPPATLIPTIDPVAFLGDRWFLGKIYFYRESGEYFHIPLTNFAGWIFVAGTTLTCFTALNSWMDRIIPKKEKQITGQALLGPALYFGVLAFNLGVTFYIGEFLLGAWGTLIFTGIIILAWFKIRKEKILHGL